MVKTEELSLLLLRPPSAPIDAEKESKRKMRPQSAKPHLRRVVPKTTLSLEPLSLYPFLADEPLPFDIISKIRVRVKVRLGLGLAPPF